MTQTLPDLNPLLAPAEAMLHWPGLAQTHGATHARSNKPGRQINRAWALPCPLPHRAQFGRVLALHRPWQPDCEREVRSFEPRLSSFMHCRFGKAQRFAQQQHDLAPATQPLGNEPLMSAITPRSGRLVPSDRETPPRASAGGQQPGYASASPSLPHNVLL